MCRMAGQQKKSIQAFEREVADFTLEATNCRTQFDAGTLLTSLQLYTRQQTLCQEWNKVCEKYLKVEYMIPEPIVRLDGVPMRDGPWKLAYLGGRALYIKLQLKLQEAKTTLE